MRCAYVLNDEVRLGQPVRQCGARVWRGSYCQKHWQRCHQGRARSNDQTISLPTSNEISDQALLDRITGL